MRKELKLPFYYEFHFNKLKNTYRKTFLESVASYKFSYFSIIVNKEKLWSEEFQNARFFYKYTCGLILQNARPWLSNAKVTIDGSGSAEFKRGLSLYLRKQINDFESDVRFINTIIMQDSHRNNLLQMTDMLCGAIARDFNRPEENGIYRKIISHKEVQVIHWP